MANKTAIPNDDLRAICVDHAMSIRESQVDIDTPIFAEEVIEDAEVLFQYIRKGKLPITIQTTINSKV